MREYATQMEAAKKGIITPEMKIVAEKEYIDPEELRALVAKGEVAIPCNINHKAISPEGVGSRMRTKINVNLGISGDAKNYDNEMKKVDETTLENLLYLSRLSPESTDMATLKKQVDDIVGYFDILSKYDDSENPYDAYPTTEAEKLREDEVVPGLEMHDVKKVNAENFLDGYFQVPKVLGEGA